MITSSPNWAAIIYSNSQYSKKSSWSIYDGKVIQSNPLTLPTPPPLYKLQLILDAAELYVTRHLLFYLFFFLHILNILFLFKQISERRTGQVFSCHMVLYSRKLCRSPFAFPAAEMRALFLYSFFFLFLFFILFCCIISPIFSYL